MTRRLPRLTPEKRRLLAELVKKRQPGASAQRDRIAAADRSQPLPLSFGQERLWFLDQLAPGNPYYNDCEAFRVRGPLDTAALGRVLNHIVARHEILRTTFPTHEGRPYQQIAESLEVPLPVTDLGALEPEQQRTRTSEIAGDSLDRPFDLERLPLFRFHLVRHAEEDHVLLFTLHHIIFDGWSLGVFVGELGAFYEAEIGGITAALPALRVQYADFALWQRQRMQGARHEEQLEYWHRRLAPPLPELVLPADRERPAVPTFRGGLCPIDLGGELSAAARQLGRREDVTLFVVLLSAYKALLLAASGQTDLVVGTPIANRNHSETELLLGFFLNTLALRTDLSGGPTFRQLLGRVAETNTGASENQELPFERLVAKLNPERQLNYNPLFQVWFTLLSAPMPKLDFHGLSLEFADIETRTARFDLALILWQDGERVHGHFEYSRDLFRRQTVERLARHYRVIVDRAIQRPDAPLDEIVELLESRERDSAARARAAERKAKAQRLSQLRRRGGRGSRSPHG